MTDLAITGYAAVREHDETGPWIDLSTVRPTFHQAQDCVTDGAREAPSFEGRYPVKAIVRVRVLTV